ncbi:terminase small subunit [Lysinibacillus fusiformis]|uniref:terminase small subunit n=1 Tax=Lysinibacillus fusiformis TaxID=28031 RepID=UPI0034E25ABA
MARNTNRNKAWKYYLKNKGKVTLKAIAAKFSVSESTIRRWKKEDRWNDEQPSSTRKKKTVRESPQKALKKTVEYELITSNGLNDRQLFFCMYYVKYWNATKAYQKAYQCDYITANRNAHRMMVNEGIKEEIVRLKKQLADSVMLDARQVLQKYIDIAFADITDFVEFGTKTYTTKDYVGEDSEGKPIYNEETHEYSFVGLKEANQVDGTIITEIRKGKDGVAVKLADKMAALAILSKYTDLLDDNQLKRLREERLKADIKATEAKAW